MWSKIQKGKEHTLKLGNNFNYDDIKSKIAYNRTFWTKVIEYNSSVSNSNQNFLTAKHKNQNRSATQNFC